MPSRAELRVIGERALRAVVIAALAIMLWQSLRKPSFADRPSVESRNIAGSLPAWSRSSVAPRQIHVEIDSTPSRVERDWLEALRASGSSVSWAGNLAAVMIDAQPLASPAGGIKVRIAAPPNATVEVADEAGVIDSIESRDAGASLIISSAVGNITSRVGKSVAMTVPGDSISLRKVLVIGDAGWESKFVAAALEESGWKVDAFIRVAPGIDVTQGSIATIDTARYSAVVALDNSVASYAEQIARFARSGGGVVLAPAAAQVAAMGPLRSGGVGDAAAPAQVANISGSISRATLAMAPILDPRGDAVPLERRSGTLALAARRLGAGRVLQSGYEDTWRWRMAGGETSVRDHRGWWTELVSNVAYAPRVALPSPKVQADDAPLADLVSALGPPRAKADVSGAGFDRSHLPAWLFVLLSLGLIGEVVSRRLRGAR
ncbi:MAG TPA: hypothetical protein VJB15_10575 [Rhodothermia bacterium]|nr:hypothetical protein [Rhodothermia bacterium]